MQDWITTTRAAELAQVGRSTIMSWCDGELITHRRLGKFTQISHSDLQRFLHEAVRPARASAEKAPQKTR